MGQNRREAGTRFPSEPTTRHRDVHKSSGITHELSGIDFLFTNDIARVFCDTEPGIGSDHDILMSEIRLKKAIIFRRKQKFVLRDWRNYSPTLAMTAASKRTILFEDHMSIEQRTEIINDTLLQIVDEVAPYRVIRSNRSNNIINNCIAALTKKRDRKKTGTPPPPSKPVLMP